MQPPAEQKKPELESLELLFAEIKQQIEEAHKRVIWVEHLASTNRKYGYVGREHAMKKLNELEAKLLDARRDTEFLAAYDAAHAGANVSELPRHPSQKRARPEGGQ